MAARYYKFFCYANIRLVIFLVTFSEFGVNLCENNHYTRYSITR